jgi:L,D-transpeptidase catalytic domain
MKARMQFKAILAGFLLCVVAGAFAQGAKTSMPVDLPPSQLKAGEFIWAPEVVPSGPLVMVISLDEQLAYVYRNGLRIGVSTVSTGKKGYETPTGVFTILQKHKVHFSSLYDDAPMPYMQRLTWGGVALHAGHLPGYPASHGCIRLPYEFARRLYDVTDYAMTVVVASSAKQNAELAHPGLFAPSVGVTAETAPDVPRLSWFQAYRWAPEKAPEGPLTILVSTADERVLVIRNGVEIGRARISIAPGLAPIGTQAYVLLAGDTGVPSTVLPGRNKLNWQSIPMPGYSARLGSTLDSEVVSRVTVSPEFGQLVYDQMKPGTSLVVTDAAVLPKTTGPAMTVITSDDEAEEAPAQAVPAATPPITPTVTPDPVPPPPP